MAKTFPHRLYSPFLYSISRPHAPKLISPQLGTVSSAQLTSTLAMPSPILNTPPLFAIGIQWLSEYGGAYLLSLISLLTSSFFFPSSFQFSPPPLNPPFLPCFCKSGQKKLTKYSPSPHNYSTPRTWTRTARSALTETRRNYSPVGNWYTHPVWLPRWRWKTASSPRQVWWRAWRGSCCVLAEGRGWVCRGRGLRGWGWTGAAWCSWFGDWIWSRMSGVGSVDLIWVMASGIESRGGIYTRRFSCVTRHDLF